MSNVIATVVSTDVWLRRIQHISLFPRYSRKYNEAQRRTTTGALLTIVMVIIVLSLVYAEVAFYNSVEVVTSVEVDQAVHGTLPLYLNVTFPNAHCDDFDIEVVDVGGKKRGMGERVTKRQLSGEKEVEEKPEVPAPVCGSCYGAEDEKTPCCRTCEDVLAVYLRRGWLISHLDSYEQCARSRNYKGVKGCNVQGVIELNRINGQLHILGGRGVDVAGRHVYDQTQVRAEESFDPTHVIHTLGFGEERHKAFPNPLDGRVSEDHLRYNANNGKIFSGLYRYFLIIVPTVLEDINGTRTNMYRYSLTTHFKERKHEADLLGIFLIYDLSPVQAHFRQRGPYKSWIHFALHLCAIVGGVFTVSALVDSFLYKGMQRVREKMSIGKQT